MYILGTDISKWQDDNSTPQMMDFVKAKSEGLNFSYIKISQANWLDQDYTINWNNAKLAGMPRGGYHFMDWTVPAVTQARFFFGALEKDMGELEPVLDFECRTNVPSKEKACQAAYDFVLEFERLAGIKPTIYTSPSYWKEFGSTNIWWKQFKLWIANYYVDKPSIPSPWDKWYMWQFTDRGDGIRYGAESYGLDLNYFNNIDYEFKFDHIPEPPKPPEQPEEFPFMIETTPWLLNVRTEPIIKLSTKIGTVCKGKQLVATNRDGDWYKVAAYVHKDYVKKI